MATFIEAQPSLGNQGTKPSNAGELIRGDEWGIDNTLSGFIVQSEEIATERMTELVADQKNSIVGSLDYDEHQTLTLGVIGDTNAALPEVGDITFSYAGKKWKVQSVTYNGAYNAKKMWSIVAERWHNFPPQT